MSTKSSDQLTAEVTDLLTRTDALLTSSGGDRGLEHRGQHSGRISFKEASRTLPHSYSVRSSADVDAGDALSEAASRLRGSFETASRKFSSIKRSSSLAKSHGADIFRRKLSGVLPDSPIPRFVEGVEAGQPPSVRFSDPSAIEDPNLASLASSLPGTSVGAGRSYNSFGGLQDMVSMVGELLAPTSPRAAAGGPDSHTTPTRLGGSGVNGPGTTSKLPQARSLSRLGSPPLSPRSPLVKGAGAPAVAVPIVSPAPKVSRRSQLKSLLSREVAQPYEVAKFKTEVKGSGQLMPDVTELAGTLQEKFDRVNRKLRSWEVIETAATERFNSAMDAALDAIFTRVNLAWPAKDLAADPSDPAGPLPASARTSSRAKGQGEAGSPADTRSSGRRKSALRAEASDDSSCLSDDSGCESPTSSASRLPGSGRWASAAAEARGPRPRDSESEVSGYSSRRDDSRTHGAQGRSEDQQRRERSLHKGSSRHRGEAYADSASHGAGLSGGRMLTARHGADGMATGGRGPVEAGGAAPAHLPVYAQQAGLTGPYAAYYDASALLGSAASLGKAPPQPAWLEAGGGVPATAGLPPSLRALYAAAGHAIPSGVPRALATAEASGITSKQHLAGPPGSVQQAPPPAAGAAGSPRAASAMYQYMSTWRPDAAAATGRSGASGLFPPGMWPRGEASMAAALGAMPGFPGSHDESTLHRPHPDRADGAAFSNGAPTGSNLYSSYSTTASPAPSGGAGAAAGHNAPVRALWQMPTASTSAARMGYGTLDIGAATCNAPDAGAGSFPSMGMASFPAGGMGMSSYQYGAGAAAAEASGGKSIPGRPLVTYDIMGMVNGQTVQYNTF